MDRDALLALAERCEQATGPDRTLEIDIFCAINGIDNARACLGEKPFFTRSLDAAMTLVPEGYDPLIDYTGIDTHGGKKVVELYYAPDDREIIRAAAATGPLALCAAALRARAVSEA